MDVRKITLSAMLIALGVFLGNILYVPIGISKCYFMQHTINVVSGFLLGPIYGTIIAFTISLLRNILGTGSILAFSGSMIGAFLGAVLFKYSKNIILLILGEVVGTGIIGGIVAFYIGKFVLGQDIGALFFVYPFLLSTMVGSGLGFILLKTIKFNDILTKNRV